MPGRQSCIVAKDADNADIVWVTEVRDSAARHAESMDIPEVKESMKQAMPIISGLETIATTIPALRFRPTSFFPP
jgi:hypothetical protein